MSRSLRIIFFGTSDFSAHHLNALLDYKYNVVGVFTQPDRPAGRGQKIISNPVKIIAKEKRIPVFQPISLQVEENQQLINKLNADLLIVVAYGLMLPQEIINIPYFGCINVHASLLPRWRGAAPIQRSILAGDKETGISIMQINAGLDTGNIIHRISCPISDKDTSATLYNKLSILGQNGLIKTLQKIIKGEIFPEIQDESLATYANKLKKSEAYIDWFLPANQLDRCVRAFNPWPISWIRIHKQLVKVWRASVIQMSVDAEPGTIIHINKNGIQVATSKNILNLEELQLASKKKINAQEFLNACKWIVSGMRLI